jgi:hypothetical protein
MTSFFTPPGYSGTAELTASSGLEIVNQGLWKFSQSGYNDGATFGLSLTHPKPLSGGTLSLSAQAWTISTVGNDLTSYTDISTGITYPADQCQISITGKWVVKRTPNSNSFNGVGVIYTGSTVTDLGSRDMTTYLLDFESRSATYVIQGSGVTGGAQDTFSNRVFSCVVEESASTDNSNREFQSNSTVRPVWVYSFRKSWQI